jgi:transcriptional regulator with XRE-family HTH domain
MSHVGRDTSPGLHRGCGHPTEVFTAGPPGAEAARRAGLSQSKVSRAETGTFLPTEDDVKTLCRVYRASPDARRQLLDVTRELRERPTSVRVVLQRGGWWMQQRTGSWRWRRPASDFAPTAVIGLLQTRSYINALLGEWLTGEDRQRMILSRLAILGR